MSVSEALRQFARGEIRSQDLESRLTDWAVFARPTPGSFEVRMKKQLPRVMLVPEDVAALLRGFELGYVGAVELAEWGTVLHALDAYECNEPDAVAEVLWTAVGEAALATANPAFSKDRARSLREVLETTVASGRGIRPSP